ncbi:HAD family hydrolase, partial [Burkholderia sp. SG-MS1]|nr:HAD family hydrolase [Paraburkholderia sp. SG-MS1]
ASHIPDGYADVLRKMGMTRIMRHMDELPALIEAGVRGEFGDVQS